MNTTGRPAPTTSTRKSGCVSSSASMIVEARAAVLPSRAASASASRRAGFFMGLEADGKGEADFPTAGMENGPSMPPPRADFITFNDNSSWRFPVVAALVSVSPPESCFRHAFSRDAACFSAFRLPPPSAFRWRIISINSARSSCGSGGISGCTGTGLPT